jgi:pimeloyl-ACP methyl ester carboxylesterase
MSTNLQDGSQPTVVLVHGAWADGSGWQGVYNLLRQDGHEVRVVQSTIVALERRGRNETFHPSTLRKLAQGLGVDTDDLLEN